MKRIIYYIAIATLLCTTSCKVDDGDTRDIMGVGKTICASSITQMNSLCSYLQYIFYAEVYINASDEEVREQILATYLKPFDEVVTDGNIISLREYYYKDNYRELIIKTDGTSLKEGGEWTVGENRNVVIKLDGNRYTVKYKDFSMGYNHYTENYVGEATLYVEDLRASHEEPLQFRFSGTIHSKDGESSVPEYNQRANSTFDIDIIEPITCKTYGIYMYGAIETLFTDNHYETVDKVVVEFSDNEYRANIVRLNYLDSVIEYEYCK